MAVGTTQDDRHCTMARQRRRERAGWQDERIKEGPAEHADVVGSPPRVACTQGFQMKALAD